MQKFKKHFQLLLLIIFSIGSFYAFDVNTNTVYAEKSIRIVDIQGCTYWITKASKKRHNSTCRWYKNSKGYCTNEKIGIACKVCGG